MGEFKTVNAAFSGNLQRGRNRWIRAGSLIDELSERIFPLEARLREDSGFSRVRVPKEKTPRDFSYGPVTFYVDSEPTTKRPQYKDAVLTMEDMLAFVPILNEVGLSTTGIIKRKGQMYIKLDGIRQIFGKIVDGVLFPNVKQTLTYEVDGKLASEGLLTKLKDPGGDMYKITVLKAIFYVRSRRAIEAAEQYIEAYENVAEKARKSDEVIEVIQTHKTKGIVTKTSKRKGARWAEVVKHLITVNVKKAPIGELDIILDRGYGPEMRKELPGYDTLRRIVRGHYVLYVSIDSLFKRIQQLRREYGTSTTIFDVKPIEIVK